MIEKYERQMKKGVLDMLILRLLEYSPKYGYQMISELKEKSGDAFCLKEGTLYPVLYRLEENRYVESYWQEASGKQVPRKYYRITAEGREALAKIAASWEKIAAGISQIMEETEYDS